jgi:hypothetical protein
MNNKNKSTYSLLVDSEEKGLGILETVLCVLVAISVVISIWQFAEQTNRLPVEQVAAGLDEGQRT